MKRFVFFLGSAVITIIPTKTESGWSRTYGEGGEKVDQGFCMEQTDNGNFIVVGETMTYGAGAEDIWLLKINSNGDTFWTKTYGSQYSDYGNCVAATPDGGFMVLGRAMDTWLLKTDKNGDTLWSRRYTQGRGSFIQPTFDGGYIMVGSISLEENPTRNLSDIWVVKLDSLGNITWDSIFGGEDCDDASCVRQTDDGGYVITGTVDAWQGLYGAGVFWMKLDSAGAKVWVNGNCEGMEYAYQGYSVQKTSNKGFIISGHRTAVVSEDFRDFLIKVDSLGNTIWSKMYMSVGSSCVQETHSGDFISVGSCLSLVDGNDGELRWQKYYGGGGRWILCTSDGGFLVTGYKDQKLWLLKTDSNGDTLGISEPPPVTPVTHHLEILSPIGSEVTLRYSDCPQGFSAVVFDASGRKVDELKPSSPSSSGWIEWGAGFSEGIYFIKTNSSKAQITKIVLIK